MKKVHIIRRPSNKVIGGVYADYRKACQAAEEANKRKTWLQRLLADTEWVVQTFNVKD